MSRMSANQDALPFARGKKGGLIAYALPIERRLVGGMSAAFLIVIALYVYFVIASIVHVAARQELALKMTTTKAAVSVLETEYLTKTEGITESYALAQGYVESPKQVYVERASAVSFQSGH